jgi:hypothetical protein
MLFNFSLLPGLWTNKAHKGPQDGCASVDKIFSQWLSVLLCVHAKVNTVGTKQSLSVLFFSPFSQVASLYSASPPRRPENLGQILTEFLVGFSEGRINISATLEYQKPAVEGQSQ